MMLTAIRCHKSWQEKAHEMKARYGAISLQLAWPEGLTAPADPGWLARRTISVAGALRPDVSALVAKTAL